MAALREGTEAVEVESVLLKVDGRPVEAIHARPEGMPRAGMVIAPDMMGLRPLFEEMARSLATHGLAVLAVEPWAVIPAEERATLDAAARMARCPELDDDFQVGALEAAADYLVVHDDVSFVSLVGFCMGGHFTLKAAGRGRFDRTFPFYGMIRTPDAWKGPKLGEPLDDLADASPTLAFFGSVDPWTPPDDIEALRQVWQGRDDCEIVVIEGADHGFVHDPDRPAHRADDAAAAWDRVLALALSR